MPIFTGVGVALVTLFDADLGVDVDATAALASDLVEEGVAAVLVAGTTGEAVTLDAAERVALITAVREVLPADVPVIAGTGAASARQAATLTAMAGEAGADAALVLSPPRSADPRPYFAAVARAAGGLPLLAYHFPEVSPPGIAM
ncbi:MAG TPA: dihydrodipicolinate synthase family protein, partial [Euzebya sp.]|nr:dihydrodipicolinate synthase family protein [Euzebya sp.]